MSPSSTGSSPELSWCSARLTNGARLADELALSSDATDQEVVAAAVVRWGEAASGRLQGPWAYARRDGDDVVIVRDALGAMPAYWTRSPSGVIASDSLGEAIDAHGSADPDATFAWATRARALETVPERTPAIGVHRVPPGSVVRVSPGGSTATRWWRPETLPRARRLTVDEAAAELRALLLAVIDDHAHAALQEVVAESPAVTPHRSGLGAHLSGGLDSTTVALLVQRALVVRGTGLDAVASWSPHPDEVEVDEASALPYDERRLVADLAAEHDLRVLFGPQALGEADWLAALDPVVQPRSTLARESRLLPLWADAGVRVVFSGWGGDEFASFNGRKTNRALVRGLRVGPVLAAHRELSARGRGPVRAAGDLVADALPETWRPGRLRGEDRPLRTSEQFIAETGSQHPDLVAAHEAHQRALRDAASPREVQLCLLANDHLARRIESWHEAGRRFGVAYRYPLLDVRLVEWALRMPPEVFRLGGHSRRVFRLAVDGLVPDSVRMTSKDDPVLLDLVRQAFEAGALRSDG